MSDPVPLTPKRQQLIRRFMRVFNWLYAGDYDIECHKVSAVVARFRQSCCTVYHGNSVGKIHPGELCIVERAKVDGYFRSTYTCQGCIERAEGDLR